MGLVNLVCREGLSKIVLVSFGAVAANFENFRNKTSAGSPFELDDDVERVADVRLDSAIR